MVIRSLRGFPLSSREFLPVECIRRLLSKYMIAIVSCPLTVLVAKTELFEDFCKPP